MKTRDVCPPKPLLAASFHNKKFSGKFLLKVFNNIPCSIGRPIIHNENMKFMGQRENLSDYFLNIFLLVIGGYNDDAVRHLNFWGKGKD